MKFTTTTEVYENLKMIDSMIRVPVNTADNVEHWYWDGPRHPRSGHPMYAIDYAKSASVVFFLFKRYFGRKPRGKVITTCGDSACINPSHMSDTGTVTEEDKKAIRERWANHLRNLESMRMLGEEFGLTKQRVWQIIGGDSPWRIGRKDN